MTENERLEFAVELAMLGGRATLEWFGGRHLQAEEKDDGSPVTIADRTAEKVMRERIAQAFPEDGVIGEEFGSKEGSSPYTWVLDPIDGTKSFIHGVPLYGTLVACVRDGRSVVGVCLMPALDEMICGAVGCGAWHRMGNGPQTEARVSECRTLHDATVCTTGLEYFRQAGAGGAFGRLIDEAALVRGWSDCYAHVLLATGRIDAVVEPVIKIWDIAHLPAILGEAGGQYTNWSGEVDLHSPMGIATCGQIHDELLRLLSAGDPSEPCDA